MGKSKRSAWHLVARAPRCCKIGAGTGRRPPGRQPLPLPLTQRRSPQQVVSLGCRLHCRDSRPQWWQQWWHQLQQLEGWPRPLWSWGWRHRQGVLPRGRGLASSTIRVSHSAILSSIAPQPAQQAQTATRDPPERARRRNGHRDSAAKRRSQRVSVCMQRKGDDHADTASPASGALQSTWRTAKSAPQESPDPEISPIRQ
mmetsp:Transcript_94618/g.238533  ORF Transcript_94618/g.238533 Transcript_94618/m.238533 type:complete len:200 (-) Transcript_94618:362-961(-)